MTDPRIMGNGRGRYKTIPTDWSTLQGAVMRTDDLRCIFTGARRIDAAFGR